ncbi:peptidoglycan-binding protein [Massilia sp. BJB1822]|uniref:CIS tube protein n=1 Tax=Massilia sp. BJB1822 TaxID=2744470 RepID=UPI001594428B|nr:peptidoglycan-binding protein [Massilia sp. BJB1822]NVD97968.1 peptidoglycan-binding protein [Massilia sp. BJB1822]
MAEPARATLVIHWTGRSDEAIALAYNPAELSFDKGVQLAEITIPGLDSPLQQFVRGQAEKLSLELFFDSTDDGMASGARSVTEDTDKIYALTRIEPSSHAPPQVSFIWGKAVPGRYLPAASGNHRRESFRGVVESVKQRFTLFSPEGVPLRATVTLSIREFVPLHEQLARANKQSPDKTHAHVLRERETLAHVAASYYLRAQRWRPIASENAIDDARRLAPGRLLRVPALVGGRRTP